MAATALTAAAGSVSAASISPAVEYTSVSTVSDQRTYTLGYSFSLSAPVTVNALGYWDDGRGQDHQVGVWDSSQNLVAFTTVLGGDPVVGHFRWDTINNLVLPAGQYTIGGAFLGFGASFPVQATGLSTISQFSWIADEQAFGPGLNFPSFSSGAYGQNGILAADFSVATSTVSVPEPKAWLLTILGFGALGAALRARRRQVV
jgi:hypothetical protein